MRIDFLFRRECPSHPEARALLRHAHALRGLTVVGVDCHIGSQLTKTSPFTDAIARLVGLVGELAQDGIKVEHIDVASSFDKFASAGTACERTTLRSCWPACSSTASNETVALPPASTATASDASDSLPS